MPKASRPEGGAELAILNAEDAGWVFRFSLQLFDVPAPRIIGASQEAVARGLCRAMHKPPVGASRAGVASLVLRVESFLQLRDMRPRCRICLGETSCLDRAEHVWHLLRRNQSGALALDVGAEPLGHHVLRHLGLEPATVRPEEDNRVECAFWQSQGCSQRLDVGAILE